MKKRVVIIICILTLLSSQAAVPVHAAMSTPQSIVVYSVIILGAVETVNLVVRAIVSLASKNPKVKAVPPKNIETNSVPAIANIVSSATNNTNRSVALVIAQSNTNRSVYVSVKLPTPILIMPQTESSTTNRTIVFSWLLVTNNNSVTYRIVTDEETNVTATDRFEKNFTLGKHLWKVQAIVDATNRGDWSEVRGFQIFTNVSLFTSTAIFTNLTESEKDDILMFGADYYYLVSLAYYGVKKYDKSREFMLHSLAIGSRVKEGTKFLKETLKVKEKDISNGVTRYIKSR